MIAQWRTLPHKFGVNLWNFEVKAGKAAKEVFQKSFELRRLNTSGSFGWKSRRDPKPHPILNETSTLKNSIRWKHLDQSNASGVRIYTDPTKFGTAKRHAGFCYAAVHNARDGAYRYGNTGVPSVQRQFIGHSTVLKDQLNQLSVIIFNGFPK